VDNRIDALLRASDTCPCPLSLCLRTLWPSCIQLPSLWADGLKVVICREGRKVSDVDPRRPAVSHLGSSEGDSPDILPTLDATP